MPLGARHLKRGEDALLWVHAGACAGSAPGRSGWVNEKEGNCPRCRFQGQLHQQSLSPTAAGGRL